MSGPGDLKAERNARERRVGQERPKLSIVGRHSLIHQARATEYGADKYARGNYHGLAPGIDPALQVLEYVDAMIRHLTHVSQAMNVALGNGGDVRAAFGVTDDDASGGFPASHLPHMSHVLAGAGIVVEIAVANGLLPPDPGQPWKRDPLYQEVLARRAKTTNPMPQKEDPDAERRRIASLAEGGNPSHDLPGEFKR